MNSEVAGELASSGNLSVAYEYYEKWFKNIILYYLAYKTIKNLKYVKICSVNLLYLIFNKMNGYFEENNGNQYLKLVPTNESKEKNKNLWRTLD